MNSYMNFAAFFLAAYVIGEFRIGNTIAKTVNENDQMQGYARNAQQWNWRYAVGFCH